MSAYNDIREQFLREVARNGWNSPRDVRPPFDTNVPDRLQVKWLQRLYTPLDMDYSQPHRLINHFKIGADPEFCFLKSSGERITANDLNLKAGLAWGADNNGRLAEIRPHPSRHALKVLASIWSTLHWMSVLAPEILAYSWRSGAYCEGDGLGGHIHFGRKRPSFAREVQALDYLSFMLFHSGVYNPDEGRTRYQRTRGHGNYGSLGDRRVQVYGYEYRTFPSWLDSPWLAYLSLVLAKLGVYDPELLPILTAGMDAQASSLARHKLRSLLAFYSTRDDDAALAYRIVHTFGFPRWDISDFKGRWGIYTSSLVVSKSPGYFIPSMIPAGPLSIKEISQALLENRPPQWPDEAPTWTPKQLPEGYLPVLDTVTTYHHPGLGEMLRGIVFHQDAPVDILPSDNAERISLPTTWKARIRQDVLNIQVRKYPELSLRWHTAESSRDTKLYLSPSLGTRADTCQMAREFLISGVFPLWMAETVKPTSLREFQSGLPPVKSAKKSRAVPSLQVYPLKAPGKSIADSIKPEEVFPTPTSSNNTWEPWPGSRSVWEPDGPNRFRIMLQPHMGMLGDGRWLTAPFRGEIDYNPYMSMFRIRSELGEVWHVTSPFTTAPNTYGEQLITGFENATRPNRADDPDENT